MKKEGLLTCWRVFHNKTEMYALLELTIITKGENSQVGSFDELRTFES